MQGDKRQAADFLPQARQFDGEGMGTGRWRLTVREEFSASHQLRHYQGKCEALHGHNFGVEVSIEGDRTDERTGMLLDFKVLKDITRESVGLLDHKHLNDLEAFAGENPSSEHLARFLFREIERRLGGYAVSLVEVTVAEKSSQSATYFEPVEK